MSITDTIRITVMLDRCRSAGRGHSITSTRTKRGTAKVMSETPVMTLAENTLPDSSVVVAVAVTPAAIARVI
jgi:hypothetical protein